MSDYTVTISRANTDPQDAPESQLIVTLRAANPEQALTRAKAWWTAEGQPVQQFTGQPTITKLDD